MKQKIENKKKAIIITLFTFVILSVLSIIPLLLHFFFNHNSKLYMFLLENNFMLPFVIFLTLFISYNGIYYYQMNFDDTSFIIRSRRSIMGQFGGKIYQVEILNSMLRGYKFISRKFSINDLLLIKIKNVKGRKSSIRIPLTIISRKRKKIIINILNNIILKNNVRRR